MLDAGDLNKPIYRHMAEEKWREYPRLILMQRLTQMNIMPDVLPHFDPILDVTMSFGKKKVQPGEFVEAKISEVPASLRVQAFERGEKLITIALVDADVPNTEKDGYDFRCHFLATNITISPTSASIDLSRLTESQILLPWLPAFAQKGSHYHRMAFVILQNKDNVPIDKEVAMQRIKREDFLLRALMTRHMLKPIGATLFRTIWDASTADVMQKHGIEGADIEFKRKKVEPLPYKRRNPSTFR